MNTQPAALAAANGLGRYVLYMNAREGYRSMAKGGGLPLAFARQTFCRLAEGTVACCSVSALTTGVTPREPSNNGAIAAGRPPNAAELAVTKAVQGAGYGK